MQRVTFTTDGHWNCPKCGAEASGKKCANCKFLIYAGFLPRLTAGLVDGAIIWTAVKLFLFLRVNSLTSYLVITALGFLFFRLYHIGFVALWGQTPGKMVARIHVVQLDGSPVGWVHAILRNSVETTIVMILTYYEIHAALNIPPLDFASALFEQREELMQKFIPHFTVYLGLLSRLYVYSEYVVMWLNKRKRAIHDFIGGTVVIHDPRQSILPWRRLKFVSDLEDKMEEMSFEDFLQSHSRRQAGKDPEKPLDE